jgi:hypothetical protein
MNKQVKHAYKGMNQDLTKSQFPNEFYFEGKNIRIVATDSQTTQSVTNEKGNELILTIPTPIIESNTKRIKYNTKYLNYTTNEIANDYSTSNGYLTSKTQIIIGHTFSRNNLILLTTDNNGFDCVWKINDITYDITLLYMRNLQFNITNPIQCLNNFENEIIDKIYWVDSKNQMRFLNINQSIENGDLEELIDVSSNLLNIVGKYTFTQPIITKSTGGFHTAGMIQYAYNLYKINGSQTKISPLSELISLDNNIDGGGDLNENVSTLPIININTLDNNYTNINLYAIKYTSYNQIPSVNLILDKSIIGLNEVTYYDDGNIINPISLEEFVFLGSNIIIPKHINTKQNILFLANYKEKNLEVNIDTRTYSFSINNTTTNIYNSLEDDSFGNIISSESSVVVNNEYNVPEKFSAININYDVNKYQYNSNVVGGEGKYLKYELVRSEVGVNNFVQKDTKGRFFKDREIYRLAIKFYNKYGQNTTPKWIADFKVNTDLGYNLNDKFASLKIELKTDFYVWLDDSSNFLDENGSYDDFLKPVGYKLLIAKRNLTDRTIVCQGLINGMMSNIKNGRENSAPFSINAINYANNGDKLPSLMRRFDNYLCPQYEMASYDKLDRFHPEDHPNLNILPIPYKNRGGTEVYKSASSDFWLSETFQFNKMMQLFSPEVEFNIIQDLSNVELNTIGAVNNNYNSFWGQIRNIETKEVLREAKVFNAISAHDVKAVFPGNLEEIRGDSLAFNDDGLFNVTFDNNMEFIQLNREYLGVYYDSFNNYKTYSTPLIVNKGQGRTVYNNNQDLVFYNSLQQLTADGDKYLYSVNSWGCKNITFVLGNNNTTLTKDRLGLENIYEDLSIVDTGVGVIAEFSIPNILIYLGNIYGGNSYESKKRTSYIEIGDYQLINNSSYLCKHPGDTYVQNYKFTKLVKTDTEVYSKNSQQHTEIVSFKVETTVDLKNRNDLSLTFWDNRFQPQYDEFQKYNTVYSQQSTLIENRDLDYNFKKVDNFDTTVISTKVKIPGEIIDSWTDIQVNNVLHLKGAYGPINSIYSFKDKLFTFQDSGVAYLSILPRVQVQGDDGLSLELGTGAVLQDYEYVTTESGSINKWSVTNSPSAIYYYDSLNKSFNMFQGQIQGVSDVKGLHTLFQNNNILQELKIDNPLINQGVSSGYDYINNDVFLTLHQRNKSFTLAYNENTNFFTSFYDYLPSIYMSKGDNFITTSPNLSQIYKQYAGEYNTFYGVKHPSYIIFNVNPESDLDCVFDNVNFKSDVTLNNIDQPDKTLTKIQAYNDYQDSTLIPLVVGRNNNLRRKFRDWNALIPRQGRNRIRAPYIKLKLQFDNPSNYKFVLHPINVYYTI